MGWQILLLNCFHHPSTISFSLTKFILAIANPKFTYWIKYILAISAYSSSVVGGCIYELTFQPKRVKKVRPILIKKEKSPERVILDLTETPSANHFEEKPPKDDFELKRSISVSVCFSMLWY